MKTLLLLGALLLCTGAQATTAETVKFVGPFEIKAEKGHKGATIAGEMKLLFTEDVLTKVETHLTSPVFGKTDMFSKEAYFFVTSEVQMAVATLYVGAPHKFFLVWVGNLLEDGTAHQGYWYRVNQPIDKIKETLSKEITEDPAGWLKVGVGSFAPPKI